MEDAGPTGNRRRRYSDAHRLHFLYRFEGEGPSKTEANTKGAEGSQPVWASSLGVSWRSRDLLEA